MIFLAITARKSHTSTGRPGPLVPAATAGTGRPVLNRPLFSIGCGALAQKMRLNKCAHHGVRTRDLWHIGDVILLK